MGKDDHLVFFLKRRAFVRKKKASSPIEAHHLGPVRQIQIGERFGVLLARGEAVKARFSPDNGGKLQNVEPFQHVGQVTTDGPGGDNGVFRVHGKSCRSPDPEFS